MFKQVAKYDVFISYETSTGKDYGENLKNALNNMELNVFLANEEIAAWDSLNKEIYEALEGCKYFVIIITYGVYYPLIGLKENAKKHYNWIKE